MNQQFLAFLDHVLDLGRADFHAFFEVLARNFLERQEAVTFFAVIDEAGFQRGFNSGDNGFVNVALALFAAFDFSFEVEQFCPSTIARRRSSGCVALISMRFMVSPQFIRGRTWMAQAKSLKSPQTFQPEAASCTSNEVEPGRNCRKCTRPDGVNGTGARASRLEHGAVAAPSQRPPENNWGGRFGVCKRRKKRAHQSDPIQRRYSQRCVTPSGWRGAPSNRFGYRMGRCTWAVTRHRNQR